MYLVFDVGGTFIKYGLLNDEGTVLEKGKVPSHNDDKDGFLEAIQTVYHTFKERQLKGIALSIPGLVDVEKGMLLAGGSLKCMRGCCVMAEVSALCDGLPVSVENDGKCAGLAEAWIGAAKDVPNCCVLAFGTGVAGAIILNKKVVRGNHLIAGEASYLISNPDREPMNVHHFGLEYSTIGIVKKAKKALGLENLDGEGLFELYEQGNETVTEIMNDFFFHVACQCYNLQYIVDPDVICIGGGISEQPSVLAGIQKYCQLIYDQTMQFRVPTVVNCQFRNDSNMIGALYHFKQTFEGL